MQPDPTKIQALQDPPTPDSQAKLQSFLALINYLQPFIPGLTTKTTFLWEQLVDWDWHPSTDTVFQCLKAWICQTLLSATLAYYDRSKPVMVQTDASEYWLGAALIQGSCPIVFTSKTLTDIETCCANIEWECLSVCFGVEKFHIYLYGRYDIEKNVHKLLEMIQHKPVHVTSLGFSRCFCACRSMTTPSSKVWQGYGVSWPLEPLPLMLQQPPHPIAYNVQLCKAELDIIWGFLECDMVYTTAYLLTLRGWPECQQDVPCIAWHLWGTRDELSIKSGLLLKGTRVCIPPELLDHILADLAWSSSGHW